MAKIMAAELPPPGAGVTTVTCEVPAPATSTVEIAAWSSAPLTKVVTRAAPFHCTTDDGMKLPPLTASVKAAAPAVALLGEREPSVGAGLLTVFVKLRSELETTVVTSLAESLLVLFCPPPVTDALLVKLEAAVWDTLVVRVIAG